MESINNVVNLIKPNVYMASIDLKYVFFSVPIHSDHQKYLKFIFGNLFQFTSMPNGYGPAIRIFTKKIKSTFWTFVKPRSQLSCICRRFISPRRYLSIIHPDISVLTPSQTFFFLGFVISSKHRTLSLTDEKKNKIKTLLMNCLHNYQISIRELARILGNIVASFPAVTF